MPAVRPELVNGAHLVAERIHLRQGLVHGWENIAKGLGFRV